MAKSDCTEYEVSVAELALYIAQEPKFKTVHDVAQEMTRLTGVEMHPYAVADALSIYTRRARAKQQDESSKNMSNIVNESKVIGIKTKQLEQLKAEIDSGTFSEPNARTRKAQSDAVKALDSSLRELRKVKKDKQRVAKLHDEIQNMRDQLTSNKFEPKPSKKEAKINDEILKLQKTKRILSNKMRARIDDANASRIYKTFRELNGALRTMGASGDLPLGRQGAFFFYAHPIQAIAATKKTLTQSWTESQMNRVEESWKKDPQYEELERLKLIRESEEGFEDMDLVSKLPGLGYLYRMSARQQHIMLTEMRINMYKNMAWGLPIDSVPTEQQKKDIAKFVLIATGVGQSKHLDLVAQPLSQAFFAPKYTLSRLQLITGVGYWRSDPMVKKRIMSEYLRAITGYAAFSMAAWLIFGDKKEPKTLEEAVKGSPKKMVDAAKSANFAKVIQGHTRIDLGGGVPSLLVPAVQFITGEFTSSTSGKKYDLANPKYGGMTRTDVAVNFVRKRTAPIPGLVWTWAEGGKNVVGQDISPFTKNKSGEWELNKQGAQNLALGTMLPYALPTMYEIANDPTSSDAFKLTALIANAFSFGGNVYDAPGEAPLPQDAQSSPARARY